MNRPDDCRYCIDGNMPAGIHGVLHEVYKPCPVCLPVCGLCEGEGIFPADFDCFGCLTARLAGIGLHPIICPYCTGVVDLLPLDNPQEVTCHAHHQA